MPVVSRERVSPGVTRRAGDVRSVGEQFGVEQFGVGLKRLGAARMWVRAVPWLLGVEGGR